MSITYSIATEDNIPEMVAFRIEFLTGLLGPQPEEDVLLLKAGHAVKYMAHPEIEYHGGHQRYGALLCGAHMEAADKAQWFHKCNTEYREEYSSNAYADKP